MTSSRRFVFSALFAAVISVCAFFSFPLPFSPIPIVLQNMMAVLSGQLLGSAYGGVAVLIFLVAGALGLPVFSGGTGGLARFLSPTGGFLIGYLPGAIVAGIPLKRCNRPSFSRCLISSFFGFSVLYVPGILFYMLAYARSLSEALAACLLPFLLPDAIKMVLSAFLARKTKPILDTIFVNGSD